MTKIELIDWMMCDDLRREDSGKLIYIGVYPANEIIVVKTPVVLPKLIFTTKWRGGGDLKDYEFTLIDPKNNAAATVKGELPQAEGRGKISIIHFGVSPFRIEEPGEFRIEGKVNGKKYDIGTFRVGMRTNSN